MPQFGRRPARPVLDPRKADQAVVHALAATLPDFWMRAELVVELPLPTATGRVAMHYTVKSPEGHLLGGPPQPPFFQAVQRSLEVQVAAGRQPKKVTYFLQRQPDQSWSFHTQYEHY